MAVGARFRQRKLNVKAQLAILREDQLDADVDTTTVAEEGTVQKIGTGVEEIEEKELHLQAIINASQTGSVVGGHVAQLYIPTPDAVQSLLQYERVYPPQFQQPATYIRFSSTVEDCIGCPYCMSSEDDIWLKGYNGKSGGDTSKQCSEDHFEQVMYFFEETSQIRQPFAAVDNTPVLSFEEMSASFDDTVAQEARRFAADIYEYWKAERLKRGNQPLVAHLKTLKMDAAQEADDNDPYACFRRREVRQVRKTRGRDAQVTEKLKKLRKELEDARQLLDFVKRRELGRQDDLALSKQIFEQRAQVRELKRTLNIEGPEDDDLLLTQRTPRKRPFESSTSSVRPLQKLNLSRTETLAIAPETDTIVLLRDKIQEQDRRVQEAVNESVAALALQNKDFVDRTEQAILGLLTPTDDDADASSRWVTAKVEYTQQPTPPESVASDEDVEMVDETNSDSHTTSVRWAVPHEYKQMRNGPRFRRRMGRGGMFLDRRFVRDRKTCTTDRDKYDRESGDEMDVDSLDHFSTEGFMYREYLRKRGEMTTKQRSSGVPREGSGPNVGGPLNQAGRA